MPGLQVQENIRRRLLCHGILAAAVLVGWARISPAQTDDYIVTAVDSAELQQEYQIRTPDVVFDQSDYSFAGVTMRTDNQIGTARRSTRGGGGGSTMLRYDQHRSLSPPTSSTLRIGPFFSDMSLALSAGYRYVRFRGRDIDVVDGVRRGEIEKSGAEFPLSATLSMNNYILVSRRMDLSLNLRMSYYHYPLGTQPDQFLIDLTDEGIYATLSTQFHPSRNSRVLFYDDIVYLTDFVDRRGISDRLGGREYRLLQNTAGMDWDWKASSLDMMSASLSRSDTIPQTPAFDRERTVRYAEMASYRRIFSSFASGGLLLQASQSLAQDKERPDTFMHGYSLFTGLRLTQTLDMNASVGQQLAEVKGGDSGASRHTQSMTGSVILMHDLGRGRLQEFSAQRSLAESFGGGIDVTDQLGYQLTWSRGIFPGGIYSDYLVVGPGSSDRSGYRNWNSALQLKTQLTRVIPLEFSARYAMRFNEGESSGVGAADPETLDDYQTLHLLLRTGFRLTRAFGCMAYVEHIRRTADNEDLAYTRDIVGVQITWNHRF